MSTRNISWGAKLAGVYGWQTYHLHVPTILKSGSLNLLEPSGPAQTSNRCLYLYLHHLTSDEIKKLRGIWDICRNLGLNIWTRGYTCGHQMQIKDSIQINFKYTCGMWIIFKWFRIDPVGEYRGFHSQRGLYSVVLINTKYGHNFCSKYPVLLLHKV